VKNATDTDNYETIEGYSLSPQQTTAWQFFKNVDSCVSIEMRIDAPVEHRRLIEACQRVLSRTEALRTRYRVPAALKTPIQVIGETAQIHCELVLANGKPVEGPGKDSSKEGSGALAEDLCADIDVRVVVAVYPPVSSVVTLSARRLATDDVGLLVLARQIMDEYEAPGEKLTSNSDSIKYIQYADWINRHTSSAEAKEERAWLKNKVAFGREMIRLPAAVDPNASGSRRRCDRILSSESMFALVKYRASGEVSNEVVLLTVWYLLISGFSGVVGGVIEYHADGRFLPELRNTVGRFRTPVPFAMTIASLTPFCQAVKVAAGLLGDIERRQECCADFGEMFHEWARDKTSATVGFLYRNAVVYHDRRREIACKKLVGFDESERCLLSCTDLGSEMELSLTYDSSTVADTTVHDVLEAFDSLIRFFCTNGDRLCEGSPLERADPVSEDDHGEAKPPLVEEILVGAKRHPDRIALVQGSRHFSYAYLEAAANKLAAFLAAKGIGIENRVGLMVKNSCEAVIGLIGIQQSGASYVPLDLRYPKARIQAMVESTRVDCVITDTDRATSNALAPDAICLTDLLNGANPWRVLNRPLVSQSCAAYIICTSGSSGIPKPVIITHGNLAASIHARDGAYPESVDAFLLLSPLSFDSSIVGIFWTLLKGGLLVIPEERDGELPVARLVDNHQVTHLLCIPSLYSAVLDEMPASAMNSLRVAIVAGEHCFPDLARRHRSLLPKTRMVNEYGVTEATVWSTTFDTSGLMLSGRTSIGKPPAGVEIYICDAKLRCVPRGLVGEICIGGHGVGRGYFDRPAWTADKFVPNPFGSKGKRLYRTGDFGWIRGDGEIEFIGRRDSQVKVRGHRIELSAIQRIVSAHPAVRECVLQTRCSGSAQQILLFYVSAVDRPNLDQELGAWCSQQLPAFMVPDLFVKVAQMPRLPNGKIDMLALRQTMENSGILASRAPNSSAERNLLRVWEEVLDRKGIGLEEKFVAIGGDSIAAIQIAARCRRHDIQVTPHDLFRYQTVAELARHITKINSNETSSQAREIPLTPSQDEFFRRDLPEPDHFSQAVLLQWRNRLDLERLRHAVQTVVDEQPLLGGRFRRTRAGWRPEVDSKNSAVAIRTITVSKDRLSHKVLAEVISSLNNSISIEHGPLFQIANIVDRAGRNYLLWLIHHLAVDAVSWRILLDSLNSHLDVGERGLRRPADAATVALARWTNAINCDQTWERLRPSMDYWLQLPVSSLSPPVIRPFLASPDKRRDGAMYSKRVIIDVGRATMQRLSRTETPSSYVILLGAFLHALTNITGQTSLLVGLETHGRHTLGEECELHNVVGWFSSTFPVLFRLEHRGGPIGHTLRLVGAELSAVRDIGPLFSLFAHFSRESPLADQLRRIPKPAICFNYLGRVDYLATGLPFKLCRRPLPGLRGQANQIEYDIQVTVSARLRDFCFDFAAGPSVDSADQIDRLCSETIRTLETIISSV